ncbi:hypothetical protein C2R65_04250 [Helicobacter pylori]|nr:hypothetical protein C2R65_04250 [Helicobacter pylori]
MFIFILIRDIVVILLPILCIGFLLMAVRSGVQTFRGIDGDDDANDSFLVEYGISPRMVRNNFGIYRHIFPLYSRYSLTLNCFIQ